MNQMRHMSKVTLFGTISVNVSANCLLALINMSIATSENTTTDKSNWGDLAPEIAYVWMNPTFEPSTGDI